MNEIKIFDNAAFGQIRTAGTSEEPLFCLADVCRAVELANPSSVKGRLDKEDVQLIDLHALNITEGIKVGNPMATFVTESGFYDVILYSKSTKVKPFRKWITSEVLPSIRKTGKYETTFSVPKSFSEALMLAAKQQERIELQEKELKQNAIEMLTLTEKVSEMQPKVTYYDRILASKETLTVTQVAQDYGMSAKKFNILLRDLGIQHKVNGQWILYAKYLQRGYVHSYAVQIQHTDGSYTVKNCTEWTINGRLFLYEELKKHGLMPLIEQ
jgi:anti-repressor protein